VTELVEFGVYWHRGTFLDVLHCAPARQPGSDDNLSGENRNPHHYRQTETQVEIGEWFFEMKLMSELRGRVVDILQMGGAEYPAASEPMTIYRKRDRNND
jgi:hypothetical protein